MKLAHLASPAVPGADNNCWPRYTLRHSSRTDTTASSTWKTEVEEAHS